MKRIGKIVFLSIWVLASSLSLSANGLNGKNSIQDDFDWEPVMEAIIQVESHGDRNARRGNSVGVMQITPILVAECNEILKSRKSKVRFKLSDRFSVEKSKAMFLLIQSYYNVKNDIEKAIRSWNGGPRYSVKHTQRYYERVLRALH